MTKKILLFMLILMIGIVYANPEINQKAKELESLNDYLTAIKIDNWLEENIHYKFYYYPRGIETTWETKEGDCTDKAMLAKEMLESLGHEVRLVHGFTESGPHDWYEVKIDNEWTSNEMNYFKYLRKIGYGIW